MALADYDTAAEKIAALKAAQLDPSIMNIATANFTTPDIIYMMACYIFKSDGQERYCGETVDTNCFRIPPGINIVKSYTMMYIKDADIIYSNPIITYQNRLALTYSAELSTIKGALATFTTGAHGSVIVSGSRIKIDGLDFDESAGFYHMFAIPANTVITNLNNAYAFCSYFDVPSGW